MIAATPAKVRAAAAASSRRLRRLITGRFFEGMSFSMWWERRRRTEFGSMDEIWPFVQARKGPAGVKGVTFIGSECSDHAAALASRAGLQDARPEPAKRLT